MVEGLDVGLRIHDEDRDWSARKYDVGIWGCGYEKRAKWLITHAPPEQVDRWFRVEWAEHRDKHSGPLNLAELSDVGEIACGEPIPRDWDGKFLKWWRTTIEEHRFRAARPLSVFVDYSSMPRTIYGQIVLDLVRRPGLIREVVLAYVPGKYLSSLDGTRRLDGLRAIIGTEGRRFDSVPPAAVMSLGYDGSLARAVIDLFQIDHFASVYASPGSTPDSEAIALGVNRDLILRSEVVGHAPLRSVGAAQELLLDVCGWYLERRSVMLVALGPKPHVLASILAALTNPKIALRWVRTRRPTTAVEVEATGEPPCITRLSYDGGPAQGSFSFAGR